MNAQDPSQGPGPASSPLAEELKRKLVTTLNLREVDPATIGEDDALFGGGLGLDSIDALEVVVMIEREYGVLIQDQVTAKAALASIRTLAEFIRANGGPCAAGEQS